MWPPRVNSPGRDGRCTKSGLPISCDSFTAPSAQFRAVVGNGAVVAQHEILVGAQLDGTVDAVAPLAARVMDVPVDLECPQARPKCRVRRSATELRGGSACPSHSHAGKTGTPSTAAITCRSKIDNSSFADWPLAQCRQRGTSQRRPPRSPAVSRASFSDRSMVSR